jgi:hypothetical protein
VLVGAKGQLHWRRGANRNGCELHILECVFENGVSGGGVTFEREQGPIFYCPSGLETAGIEVSLADMNASVIFLPLANGLVRVEPSKFLIRVNACDQVAARVSKLDRALTFVTQGKTGKRLNFWRFIIVCGSQKNAVEIANDINDI